MQLRLMTFFFWDLITEEEKQICVFINSSKSKVRHKKGPSRGLFSHCPGSDSGCYPMSRDMVRQEDPQWIFVEGTQSASSTALCQWQCARIWMIPKNLCTFIQESFAIFSLELQFLVSRDCVGTLIKGKWDLSCHDCVKNPENRSLCTNVAHIQGALIFFPIYLFIFLII